MVILEFTKFAIEKNINIRLLIYLLGKPRIPHLLRCQGIAVNPAKAGLHPWRLGSAASSTFATIGFILRFSTLNYSFKTGKL
jgi:hypothetical protein